MNGYELNKIWYDFIYEQPDKKPIHHAIYMHAVQTCNRLGWKETFDLGTQYSMEMLGISNYRTYKKGLDDLIRWGFIEMVSPSTNQHTPNVIALVKKTNATSKAATNALLNQNTGIANNNKHINNKHINGKRFSEIEISEVPTSLKLYFEVARKANDAFIMNLKEINAPTQKLDSASFKELVNPIRLAVETDGAAIEQLLKAIDYLSMKGPNFWKKHVFTTRKLREKLPQILADIDPNELTTKNEMDQSVAQKLSKYE